jgi:protein-disulfide isomerase
LFKNQWPIDSRWTNSENLKKFASQIPEINTTKFDICFEGKRYDAFVNKDIALDSALGFKDTPSFIIMNSDGTNIQKIGGPKPFPVFKSVIDSLKNANNSHR